MKKIIKSEKHDFESYNIIKDILDYSVYFILRININNKNKKNTK